MFYLTKTPPWLKMLFKGRVWGMDNREAIYLTFDDGPTPGVTDVILDNLAAAGAKATFFCIGKNVDAHPELYRRILDEGHTVGNHTYNHLNAKKVSEAEYLENIALAAERIDSDLFRPPYGRLGRFAEKQITEGKRFNMRVIMWSVLSADFDPSVTKEKCADNVVLHATGGDIVLFHDSEKAKEKVLFALPTVLAYFAEKGFRFESIPVFQGKKNGPG